MRVILSAMVNNQLDERRVSQRERWKRTFSAVRSNSPVGLLSLDSKFVTGPSGKCHVLPPVKSLQPHWSNAQKDGGQEVGRQKGECRKRCGRLKGTLYHIGLRSPRFNRYDTGRGETQGCNLGKRSTYPLRGRMMIPSREASLTTLTTS
jgi:hypothetical protein